MTSRVNCANCKYTRSNGLCDVKMCVNMSDAETPKPCGIKKECPCIHCGNGSNFEPINQPNDEINLRKLLNRGKDESVGDISDGYNTFDGLYRQIAVLVDILIKQYEVDAKLIITLKETKDDIQETKDTCLL